MSHDDRSPLIVVTRAAVQATSFIGALKKVALESLAIPCIHIETIAVNTESRQMLADLAKGRYRWLVFTSVNAVKSFKQQYSKVVNSDLPIGVSIAAQGSKTSTVVHEELGRVVDFESKTGVSDAMAEELLAVVKRDTSTLLVSAQGSRFAIRESFLRNQRPIDTLLSHEVSSVVGIEAAIRALPVERRLIGTFFSPSAFKAFAESASSACLAKMELASIGPVTSAAIRKRGLPVALEASAPDSLVFAQELSQYCSR